MPIITTAALTALVTTLANKGLEKAFENTGEKISDGAINWIKSLFYKDEKPKKVLREIQASPSDKEKQNIAKALIENSIEDDSLNTKHLEEIIKKLPKVETNISDSKNINTGNINTGGGNVQIGDNYGG